MEERGKAIFRSTEPLGGEGKKGKKGERRSKGGGPLSTALPWKDGKKKMGEGVIIKKEKKEGRNISLLKGGKKRKKKKEGRRKEIDISSTGLRGEEKGGSQKKEKGASVGPFNVRRQKRGEKKKGKEKISGGKGRGGGDAPIRRKEKGPQRRGRKKLEYHL